VDRNIFENELSTCKTGKITANALNAKTALKLTTIST